MFDITAIFNWLEGFFVSNWYWLIPLGALLESTVLISLAAPGLVILLLAGYFAAQGVLPLTLGIILGFLGTMIGDNASFMLGRFIWVRYSDKFPLGRKINAISRRINNRTIWFLPFFHFSGYGRALVPLASGALKMPFARWIKYDIFGAVIWNVIFCLLGYWAGSYGTTIEDVFGQSHLIEWIFSALFLVWVVVTALTIWRLARDLKIDRIQ